MDRLNTNSPEAAVGVVVYIAMAFLLFLFLSPRRAVLVTLLLGWLFLPVATFTISGLPDLDKTFLLSATVVVYVVIFDNGTLSRFQPRWFDAPITVAVIAPIATSLSNGLGIYDGLSSALTMFTNWGVPYFVGRVYFSDPERLRELALGIFIGGLMYAPFCLYEMRMSPRLHEIVYGYNQHSVMQQFRYGGWRPKVFMQHGLAVGMWMTTAALCGVWLRYTKSIVHYRGFPVLPLIVGLVALSALTRSTGSIILLAGGLVVMAATRVLRSSLPLVALCLVPLCYVALRASGAWDGAELVSAVDATLGPERASSIQLRVNSEVEISERARQRILLGWGGWNRLRPDPGSTDQVVVVPDSGWIIMFGTGGLLALTATSLVVVLPPLLLGSRIPPPFWMHPHYAGAIVLALVLALWMIDNTMNFMRNPFYFVSAGGLMGLVPVTETELEQAHAHLPALDSNQSIRSADA